MSQLILIADDEASILDILRYNLEKDGYRVIVANNGTSALHEALCHHPDLIILDITMPGIDGLDLCARLRHELGTPVILLTARDSEIDKIVGLEIGADDYVTKPFSTRELLARVKAVLRRAKGTGNVHLLELRCGNICLDRARHQVMLRDESVVLTTKEFSLLEYLMSNAEMALSRHAILDHVWGYDFYGDTRTVDVHIRRLREKIEDDPSVPRYIHTISGIGYTFHHDES